MKNRAIRRLIIQETYGLSLKRTLYEADEPPAPDEPDSAPDLGADAASDDAGTDLGGAPASSSPSAGAPSPAGADPAGTDDMSGTPADPVSSPGGGAGGISSIGGGPGGGGIPTSPGATPPKQKQQTIPAPDPDRDPVATQVHKALMNAIKRARGSSVDESLRSRKLTTFLLEASAAQPQIDIEDYAGSIANLIQNYMSIVDVKGDVIKQAELYLDRQFPEASAGLKKRLKDLLRTEYHISLTRPEGPRDDYAVGASIGGGAS